MKKTDMEKVRYGDNEPGKVVEKTRRAETIRQNTSQHSKSTKTSTGVESTVDKKTAASTKNAKSPAPSAQSTKSKKSTKNTVSSKKESSLGVVESDPDRQNLTVQSEGVQPLQSADGDNLLTTRDFVLHRDHYIGRQSPHDIAFNKSLQDFALQVSCVCALETGGKMNSKEAYLQVRAYWKKLKRSFKNLDLELDEEVERPNAS